MSFTDRLARPNVLILQPYSSARSLNLQGRIFLDANESPVGRYNRYPEPKPDALSTTLASLYDCDSANLWIGRGADEAIDTLIRTFCEPGVNQILTTPPTYGFYEVCARIQNCGVTQAPLTEETFALDTQAVLSSISDTTKIVFICNPNNPTGNLLDRNAILEIVEALKERCLVVIDEAYIEFASEESIAPLVGDYPNLVVLRTLSKAYGLAGLRCGVAIAQPAVVQLMQKVTAPYPIPTPVTDYIVDTLKKFSLDEALNSYRQSKELLMADLQALSIFERIWPSATNFVLARAPGTEQICRQLDAQGILIRNRCQDLYLNDCIRITCGTEAENKALIAALKEEGSSQ